MKLTREEIAMMNEGIRDPIPEIEGKAVVGCLVVMVVSLIGIIGVCALVVAIINLVI